MEHYMIYIYIAAMALTTYLVRMLPLTVFRKPITSRYFRSFLHYVPYACLTAMTFPDILNSTGTEATLISGGAALAVAIFLAYRGKSLLVVSIASAVTVFVAERLMGIPF